MITVEISGITQSLETISGLRNRAANPSGAAQNILLTLASDVDQRFASAPIAEAGGTVLGGEDWPALSPNYLAKNPRRRGGQILRDYGRLLQSLAIGAQGNISAVRPQEIAYGTQLPKGRGLQDGIPRSNVPPRPFLFFHAQLVEQIGLVLQSYLEGL